jgi:hypothetical protein
MKRSIVATAVLLLLGAASCARSKAFQREENYFEDAPSYYNRGGPQSPTARVEAMGQPKKRVVVFTFWDDSLAKYPKVGEFASDELRRALFLSQRMILPTDLRTALETKDFLQGDSIKVAQLIREGRRLGVSILIIGRIAEVKFRQRGDEVGLLRQTQSLAAVDVEVKVFDVEGGREISAIGKSGEASSSKMVAMEAGSIKDKDFRAELTKLAVRNAMGSLVPDVLRSIEKMTWQGKIAKIVGNKIYLNAGRASGLVSGDILKVLTPGDDIYDPETGAYLGRTQGQLKGTLEVLDFMGEDAAITAVHTGGNFQETDHVRLY